MKTTNMNCVQAINKLFNSITCWAQSQLSTKSTRLKKCVKEKQIKLQRASQGTKSSTHKSPEQQKVKGFFIARSLVCNSFIIAQFSFPFTFIMPNTSHKSTAQFTTFK